MANLLSTIISGSLTVDTNVFFVDSTNNGVGIGTTSPGYPLDIVNNSTRFSFSTSTGNAIIYMDGANGDLAGGDYTSLTSDGSGNFYIATGNSERLRVQQGGNVGIGTTSPSTTLDVVSSINGINAIVENDTHNAIVQILASVNAKNSELWFGDGADSDVGKIDYDHANDSMAFITNTGERMRIDYLGNVGIGTTSPGQKLHVVGGTVKIESDGGNASGAILELKHANNNTTDVCATINFTNNVGGYAAIEGGTTGANNTGYLAFKTDNAGTQGEAVRILGNGNVGIGTTSPAHKLHVSGKGLFTDFVRFNGTTAPDFPVDIDSVDGGKALRSTRGTSIFRIDQSNDGPGYIGMQSADDLSIQTNNTSRMYITSSGNVGIGTTTPGSKLEVLGNITLRQSLSNSETVYISTNARGGGTNDADLRIGNTNSGDILIVHNDTVGIGTTSPDAKLSVNGYISIESIQSNPSTVAGEYRLALGHDATTDASWIQSNGVSGTQRKLLLNPEGGNVGIGTTSPAYKLHVQGASGADGFGMFSSGSGGTSGGVHLGYNGTSYGVLYFDNSNNNTYLLQKYAAGNLILGTNSTEKMRITNAGNVGIGTTSPGSKLEIAGIFGNIKIGDASNYNGISLNGTLDINNYNFLSRSSDKSLYINRPTGNNIYFRENNSSTHLFIESGGNVGIGTTSPSSKLNVIGNVRVSDGTDQGYVYFRQDRDDVYIGEDTFQLRMGAPSGVVIETDSNANGFSSFNVTRNTSSQFYIADSGNVGIGTTTPGGPLEIYKANSGGLGGHLILNNNGLVVANETAIMFNDSGVGGVNYIRAAISSTVEGSPFYGDLKFKTGASVYGSLNTRMIITGAGNVGIGTTSPSQKLHVVGKALITDDVQLTGSNPRIDFNSNGASSLRFFDTTNAAERMRIDTAGNVGIGTTSPGTKLDVNGVITATGGNSTNWNTAYGWGNHASAGYQPASTAITTSNIGSQSVSYATNAGQLNYIGYLIGDNWNTYYTAGKLRVASVSGSTSTGYPSGSYNYGSLLSYGLTSEDGFQMYFPENAANSVSNSRKLTYRTAWNGSWSAWKTVVDMVGDTLSVIEGPVPKIIVRGAAGYGSPTSASIELVGDADNNQTKGYRWISVAPDWNGQDLRLERYSINNGYELIGRVPKNSFNLEWQGTIAQGLSDSRVKTNVVSMTGGLDKIDQIRPVTFDWTPVENVSDREGADFGFIAQELEEVLPEVVYTRGDGYKTVMYEKVVPVLVQALKEQQATIEMLAERLKLLENK